MPREYNKSVHSKVADYVQTHERPEEGWSPLAIATELRLNRRSVAVALGRLKEQVILGPLAAGRTRTRRAVEIISALGPTASNKQIKDAGVSATRTILKVRKLLGYERRNTDPRKNKRNSNT